MANNKKMKKTTKSNLLMFGFVIVFWAVIQVVSLTGHMMQLFKEGKEPRPSVTAKRQNILP